MSPAAKTALRYALREGAHYQMWEHVEVLLSGTAEQQTTARNALMRMPMIGNKAIDGLMAWWAQPIRVSTWDKNSKTFTVTWEKR